MPLTQENHDHLSSIFPNSAFITPSDPEYPTVAGVWAVQLQRSPSLVIRPTDTPSLQTLVTYLNSPACDSVEFDVRSGGVGSATAKDVLIDMSAFDSFEFTVDWEDKVANTGEATVTLGAGQLWEEVNKKTVAQAPGWTVISARSEYVGVAGYIVMGGLSWYSNEFGMGSDPRNFLDAEVVLNDGRCVWASEEAPEVLWAMRGGRSAFSVVTRVKMRARRTETTGILGGNIIYPIEALEEVSRRVADFLERNHDPKTALYVFLLNPASPFFPAQDGVGLIIYDLHGENHARSEQGFKWAYDIPGAQDMTKVMDMVELNKLTNFGLGSRGKTHAYYAAGIVNEFDEKMVVRTHAWQEKVISTDPALAAGSFAILEPMSRVAFDPDVSPEDTAWPHPPRGYRYVIQLGCGFLPEYPPKDGPDVALKLLKEAYEEIPKKMDWAYFRPVYVEDFVDVKRMYGANLDRLKAVAKKYDPKGKYRTGLW